MKRKTTLKINKDNSKLTDYDSSHKQKKPRVPRTKRPRVRVEKKEQINSFTTKTTQ